MYRKRLTGVAVATLLICAPLAQAGSVAPALQGAISERIASADIPVIIHFADELDIGALRREVDRVLRERYSDPRQRRAKRRAIKRAMLVDGLRKKSRRAKGLVRAFLKLNGESRRLKSLWAINAVAGSVPARLIDELAGLPGVEKVVLDATVQGPGTGTAPSAPTYWNLDVTGARDLWLLGHTGTGVVVATLDSGVDGTHPDLAPRWRGGVNSWFDPYDQHAEPADLTGHGTQVMGLILGGESGGYQVGMAPDARWISAKIFDDANEATLSGIHSAYQWLLDPDGDPVTDDAPDIVNNSWALAGTVNQCNQEFAQDLSLLKEAGTAVLFSGGNFGPNADTSVSPANDSSVVSVGAVDVLFNVDSRSSRGAGACDGAIYPRLVAPGVSVLTTDRMPLFYNVVSGTSFSVAHLSGGMALLKGAFPEATVTQLESALVQTAVDLGVAGPDDDFGNGLMDVMEAYHWLEVELGGGTPIPGSLQWSAATFSVDENVPTLTVTVARSGGSSGAVSVDYSSADGSARAGADYGAAAGTLSFADGELSRSFSLSILDDSVYEGDEAFILTLSNPQGGALLGAVSSATATILDDDPLPGPVDADGDGVAVDLDCNDGDASIYPGAIEVKHDGIDQDCNGYDLTIDVTRARYLASKDKLIVWATSERGGQAGLSTVIALADGSTAKRTLWWNSKRNRWQKYLKNFSASFGSTPVAVTISGAEGAESAAVQPR